ncbi:MAG: IS982 family transposase, partial [Chloroflexi bacterium]
MDQDTFLTTLYVMIDDFCQLHGFAEKHRPGPAASLSCSEVVTLAVFGQWARFPSERAFYRYAVGHLRAAFPTLPEREQFNRLQRGYRDVIVAFSLFLVEPMHAQHCLYEALDSSGIPTRDAKRRGTGWLAGQADIGWSNRIGWYEGFHLLTSITPTGVITGFGFAPASCNDHTLAETFFAARQHPSPRLPSVGAPAQGVYVADKGFAGDHLHRRWQALYGAEVVSPPHQRSKVRWSKDWR